ncbi:MAG: serine protease [Actinomycetota bacterium]|nr:serine protease [Actinomycetota bacterium]MDQ3648472.1 serine protease [Actinomycetota bacterium]
MTQRHILSFLVAATALAAALTAPTAASAWAPEGSATIHPGVQTYTEGGQCTANFIYTSGSEVFIGQAAHCSGTGAATQTDGCESPSRPLGTKVEVNGASRPGTMVYNSWLTMQANGERDADACAYNDLALLKIDPADVGKVNPSVPGFGGPNGVGGARALADVFSYGNSSLRLGLTQTSPKQGKVVRVDGGGWTRDVYTATPGIPGDSGSGFLNRSGQALGTLSTVAVLPLPASNGVADLGKELGYARANGFGALALADGTRAFRPNLVGAILGVSR